MSNNKSNKSNKSNNCHDAFKNSKCLLFYFKSYLDHTKGFI